MVDSEALKRARLSVGAVPGDAVGPGQTPAGHGDDDVDEQDDRDADADHGPNKHHKLGQETSQA